MIYGIGIDITEIDRIDEVCKRQPGFARKVLTDAELAVYQSLSKKEALTFLAGRFSVKESFVKAYGTGLGPVALHDVETLKQENGKPELSKHPHNGPAFVSISHTDKLVMTEVILEVAE